MRRSLLKVVFFDLGGVVVDVHLDRFISALADDTGRSPEATLAAAIALRPHFDAFEKGLRTVDEIYSLIRATFHFSGDLAQFTELYTGIFSSKPDVERLIEELAQKRTLSVISNTDVLHYDYLVRTLPIMSCFQKPVTSFAAQALKPDEAIFRHALAVNGVEAKEAFFIDDKPENIAAAAALGIKGVVFAGADPLRRTLKAEGIL